jgi:hypothetical protein
VGEFSECSAQIMGANIHTDLTGIGAHYIKDALGGHAMVGDVVATSHRPEQHPIGNPSG